MSRTASRVVLAVFAIPLVNLWAQRVFEKEGNVIYEDAQRRQSNLGIGFSPVLTADGKVALIRGRDVSTNEAADCREPVKRNRIALVDPKTKQEKTIFDRGLDYGRGRQVCSFDQMQLSSDKSILYLVSLDATSGSMAIIHLASGSVHYVPGVTRVYAIETGPHRDELIYVRRVMRNNPKHRLAFPTYPWTHARANGEPIAEISYESFAIGGDENMPILQDYLRKIDATITVNGRKFP